MELKLFTTFIVVAAILTSPKHKAFTWSYRSSIYRVHWYLHRKQMQFNPIFNNHEETQCLATVSNHQNNDFVFQEWQILTRIARAL